MAESDAPVDLDALTKKQLAKQFKSVAKEIKSKDIEVKTNVLVKLMNHRYFFEGGCLPPFFDSLTPKKKTLEMCKMTLESLLEFLRGDDDESCPNGRRALLTLRSTVGDLACLEQLGACNAYHEVPKKAKKGQPPNVEDENAVQLRSLSSTALYELVRALNAAPADAHLVRQFSDVPNIIPHLCQGLKCLLPLFENEESREGCIEQLSNVLYCLSTAMSSAHAPALIECGGAATVLALLKDPKLTVSCLDILYKTILHTDGFTQWAVSTDHRRIYLDTLRRSVGDLIAAVGAGAADAAPTKDAKGGKAAKPAKGADPNAAAAEAMAKADENRALAAQVRLLSQIFLIMSTAKDSPLTPEEIGEISELLTSVALNIELWKLCNAYVPSTRAPHVPLEDTIAIICSVLGSCGLRADSRGVVCSHNAVDVLGSVLLKSRLICDLPGDGASFLPEGFEASGESFPEKRLRVQKVRALLSLRRVAEKSLLHLLTHPVEAHLPRPNKAYHWTACAGQSVASVTSEEGTRATISRLVEAVVSADTDLASRIVRLLSGVIQCAAMKIENNDEEPTPVEELRTVLGLDNAAVAANLGKFVSERARAFYHTVLCELDNEEVGEILSPKERIRKAALNREADAVGVSVQELLFFKWEEAERRGLRDQKWRPDTVDVLNVENVQADENLSLLMEEAKAEAADLLFLAVDESLTHGLYLLSDILVVSADVVKSAATTDLVESLVDVLRVCGPTPGAFSRRKEHMVSLYDPRVYNWREEHDHRNEECVGLFSMIALRGLGASVLACVAEADAKYRKYDGEIPCSPGTVVPVSTSAGYQPANLVCKIASDVCISSLMVSSRFHFGAAGDLSCGPDTESTCTMGIVEPSHARCDVVGSFLELATAISSCGLVGLASCYESLASSESSSPHYSTSLSALVSCFESDIAAGGVFVVEGDDAAELLAAPLDWAFPLHFDYFEKESTNLPTSKGSLLYRKDLWPLIATASAIIGVVSDPRSSSRSVELAVNALKNFSQVVTMQDVNQPAVADLFSAVFIAMGGGTALLSCLSCFGKLSSCDTAVKSNATEVLLYIVSRGTRRQAHWDKVLADKLEAAREAAAVAEAAGGKGKKDDKRGGGKDDKKNDKGKKGAVTEEERRIDVPVEPDDSNSDPNYGPSADAWATLLNISSNCFICRAEGASPLSCFCQSVLSADIYDNTVAVLSALLSAGVDLNRADGAGVTPLMYALAVGSRPLVQALVDAGASPDIVSSDGTPTIVYAFLSVCTESLKTSLLDLVVAERRLMWENVGRQNEKAIVCNGTCDCLNSLLAAGVDLKVSTLVDGNFPLHFACGIGQLDLTIGGVRFRINNKEYATNFNSLNTAATVQALIDRGASAKSCNKMGVLPIHIAAASGDVASVELCLCYGGGELANTADSHGYLPLHYAAACCPRHAFEVINSLLKWGDLRPLGEAVYQDHRTVLSSEDKYWHDVDDAMAKALACGDESAAVSNRRVTKKEIVRSLTKSGLSPLHLVLAGRSLSSGHLSRLMSPWDNVGVRIAVAEMFCELGGESILLPPVEVGGDVYAAGLSPVHTLGLLGVEPKKPDTFYAGSLVVSSLSALNFTPEPTQGTHVLSVKFVHGLNEVCTPAMTSSCGSLVWNLPLSSALEVDNSERELTISVWAAEVEGATSKCIGCGSLSVGMIGRGQLLIGEEISLTTVIVSDVTGTPCGSVAVVLRAVCDRESSVGSSGPIFSCQDFFTRILKSVNNDPSMCSSTCSWPLTHCRLPEQWTPLHACIVSQNRILAAALIGIKVKAGVAWSETPYLHFTAQNCSNNTFCSVLIDVYAKLKASALNRAWNDEFPLHAAVRYKNAALLNALVDCPKVNLNARDATTGATAFLEACRTVKDPKESDLYAAFERSADRLDFLIADNNGETCVDFAVRNNEVDLVKGLCDMRRNDVVERITSRQGEHDGILLTLERENIKLTKIVHTNLFEEKVPAPVLKKVDSDEEEEYAIDSADKFPSHASADTANISEQHNAEVAEEENTTHSETEALSIEEARSQLEVNERMLSILLECVVASGVAPPLEYHVHECYAAGQLSREFQEKLNAPEACVAELAGGIEAVKLEEDANAHTAENVNTSNGIAAAVPETGDSDAGDNGEYTETKSIDENRDIPQSKEIGSFDGVKSSSGENQELE